MPPMYKSPFFSAYSSKVGASGFTIKQHESDNSQKHKKPESDAKKNGI